MLETVRMCSAGVRILVVLLLQVGCVAGASQGLTPVELSPRIATGAPSRCDQSCAMNPLCAAPGASGELVLPTLQKVADVTKLVRGLLTLKDFLDEKDVKSV
ncbi:MAG TPA: hypothetical protein VLQ93_24370, partial [Myxococcaceae bacterium]|nr:hypothetical protein [Myxococcaceae bacterium]